MMSNDLTLTFGVAPTITYAMLDMDALHAAVESDPLARAIRDEAIMDMEREIPEYWAWRHRDDHRRRAVMRRKIHRMVA